jgi:hypothetical protein
MCTNAEKLKGILKSIYIDLKITKKNNDTLPVGPGVRGDRFVRPVPRVPKDPDLPSHLSPPKINNSLILFINQYTKTLE